MRVAYISGAYRSKKGINGIAENIWKAREVALKYWHLGYAVISPHCNTAFMDGVDTDKMFLEGDLEILKRCNVIVMMKGWRKSEGAKQELELAKNSRVQVIYE